ncbi:MAG: hypothetical protein ABSA33_00915 [Candidatus Micrarchaeaceae archaeon]|jgi:hypothetical protein
MTVSNSKNGERIGNLKAHEIHGALRRMHFEVVRSTTDRVIMKHVGDGKTIVGDGRSIAVKSARNEEINKHIIRRMLRGAGIPEHEFLACL